MLHWLWNLASFVVVLGVLVTFHELGHYWVARRLGVRVQRFSVGFGRPLFKHVARDGVEWVIAAIPLGGYVKMLDEREAPVPAEWRDQAFNRQTLWKRMAIVAAGPVANLVLAVVLFWGAFVLGIPGVRPVVGEVVPGSIADKAGLQVADEVKTVDDRPVNSWTRFSLLIVEHVGESEGLPVTVLRHGETVSLQLPLAEGGPLGENQSPLEWLGIKPWQPRPAPLIGQIEKNSAAERAGLKPGDKIVAIDGQKVRIWDDIGESLVGKAGKSVTISIIRDGKEMTLVTEPGHNEHFPDKGYLGIAPKLDQQWREAVAKLRTVERFDIGEAIPRAIDRTWEILALSWKGLIKLLSGHLPISNLSGPVGIAQGAGQSAAVGPAYFLNFMALISVSLAFINLLPIPLLDGGHLLFYFVELVRRRPVSETAQMMAMKLGLLFMFAMFVLALFNDLNRLG